MRKVTTHIATSRLEQGHAMNFGHRWMKVLLPLLIRLRLVSSYRIATTHYAWWR